MVNGIIKVLKSKKSYPFVIKKGTDDIKALTNRKLPKADNEVYKFVSVSGGFASICFINYVAEMEQILELSASTLRIGEKQFHILKKLSENGRIKDASFYIGALMQRTDGRGEEKYNYYKRFNDTCDALGWKRYVTNNHSKIILMRTSKNYYVLESSSNLNENPHIEQYSFENSKELYEFYYDVFEMIKLAIKG